MLRHVSAAWETVLRAGALGMALLPLGAVALLAALLALGGSFRSARGGLWIGAAALVLVGVGLGLGGLGTWLGRRTVHQVLRVTSHDWATVERILLAGYGEARDVSLVALVVMTPPALLALVAVALGVRRGATPGERGAGVAFVAAGVAASLAVLGAGAALLGVRPFEQEARSRAQATFRAELAALLPRRDCDVCKALEEAVGWRGADAIERDVPGSRERARMCIEERRKEIEEGRRALLPDCRDGLPPRVSPGVATSADRRERLRELRASPLLIDEAQRRSLDERIAAADPAPPVDPTGILGMLGGQEPDPPGTTRIGAVTVSGGHSPEVVERVVRRHLGRLRHCHVQALKKDPRAEGRIAVELVIGAEGTVISARSASSDLRDRDMVECVVRAFSNMTFPPPESGSTSTSRVPLLFTQGK